VPSKTLNDSNNSSSIMAMLVQVWFATIKVQTD